MVGGVRRRGLAGSGGLIRLRIEIKGESRGLSRTGSLIAFGGDLDQFIADYIKVGGEGGGELLRKYPSGFVENVA